MIEFVSNRFALKDLQKNCFSERKKMMKKRKLRTLEKNLYKS